MSINRGLKKIAKYIIIFSLGFYIRCSSEQKVSQQDTSKLEKIIFEQKYEKLENNNEIRKFYSNTGQTKLYIG